MNGKLAIGRLPSRLVYSSIHKLAFSLLTAPNYAPQKFRSEDLNATAARPKFQISEGRHVQFCCETRTNSPGIRILEN